MSRLLAVLSCGLAACLPPIGWNYQPMSMVMPSPPPSSTTSAPVHGQRLTIYVRGWGGRIHGGDKDDATRDVSGSVKKGGYSYADLPAFEGTQAEWTHMMACTRQQFAGLPIELVQERPPSGDYPMVIVGGTAAHLGQTNMWGWSTMTAGNVTPRGVGFVFSADHRVTDRGQRLCETLAHEIGHLLGLDHVEDCADVMAANRRCAPITFRATRRQLETTLAAWGAVAALPPPARITGVVGEPSEQTGLYPVSSALSRQGGELVPHWPVALTAAKPIARAVIHYVTPAELRGQYHCSPDGSGCVVRDRSLAWRLGVHEAGEHHMLIEVVYADGEVRRTPWFSTTQS